MNQLFHCDEGDVILDFTHELPLNVPGHSGRAINFVRIDERRGVFFVQSRKLTLSAPTNIKCRSKAATNWNKLGPVLCVC